MKQLKQSQKQLISQPKNPFRGGFYKSESQFSEKGGEWITCDCQSVPKKTYRFEQKNWFWLPSGNMVYAGVFMNSMKLDDNERSSYIFYTAEQILCICHDNKSHLAYMIEWVNENEFWMCQTPDPSGLQSRIKMTRCEVSQNFHILVKTV